MWGRRWGRDKLQVTGFCISHSTPMIPNKFYNDIIALGEFGEEKNLHIAKIDKFWHDNRNLSWGAAGSYVVPAALKMTTPTDTVVLTSFRKVVLRHNVLDDREFVLEATLEYLEKIPSKLAMPAKNHDFLITKPVAFGKGILGHYNDSHVTRDILEYTSMAVDAGILTNGQAAEFLICPVLIPGGSEVGAFPTAWAAETLTKLEAIGRLFVTKNQVRISTYDSYQVRVVGFLSERLGSFLLLKRLAHLYDIDLNIILADDADMSSGEMARRIISKIPNEIFGRMYCCVAEGEEYTGGRTTSEAGKSA